MLWSKTVYAILSSFTNDVRWMQDNNKHQLILVDHVENFSSFWQKKFNCSKIHANNFGKCLTSESELLQI